MKIFFTISHGLFIAMFTSYLVAILYSYQFIMLRDCLRNSKQRTNCFFEHTLIHCNTDIVTIFLYKYSFFLRFICLFMSYVIRILSTVWGLTGLMNSAQSFATRNNRTQCYSYVAQQKTDQNHMRNTFTNLLIHVINKPSTMLTSYYFRIANHSSSESLIPVSEILLSMNKNFNVQLRKIASQSLVIKQEIPTLTSTPRVSYSGPGAGVWEKQVGSRKWKVCFSIC